MAGQGLPDSAPANAAEQFERAVLGFCARQGLFAPQDRVIAAVSGGADSMALLVFLLRSAAALGIRVEAVHVDHGIRGERSRADAAFVADFCARHGVALHAFSAAGEGIPVPEHPSEDWARRLRYGFFDRLLATAEGTAQNGGKPGPRVWVATAHTLNDQAETLLFRLARGTGLRGAGGIRPARGAFARPLLAVGRAETEGYCAALSIPYVQDETNADPAYARNRLRAEALPALGSVNDAALLHIAAFCGRMQRLDGYFAAKGETLLQSAALPEGAQPPPPAAGAQGAAWAPLPAMRVAGWGLGPLQAALAEEEPVLDAALLALLERAGPGLDAGERRMALLKALIARGKGAVQLSACAALAAGQGGLWLCAARNVSGAGRAQNGFSAAAPAPCSAFSPGVWGLGGGYSLDARVVSYEKFMKLAGFHKKDLNSCADYAKIQDNVFLRTRRPGDTFRPPRRGVGKPLKKLYQELRLAPAERVLLPLLARGSQVLWLWGQGFAEGLAPGPGTRDVLIITPLPGEKEVPRWE